MWGKVSYQDFIKLFDDKNELSLNEVRKAFNFSISDSKIERFVKEASEEGIITSELVKFKSGKVWRKWVYRKVG